LNEGEEAMRRDTFLSTVGITIMQISVLRKNVCSFGNISV